jgi:hypothetical protein
MEEGISMKTINGETFEVRLDEDSSTIFFKGALRLSGTEDYASILDLLKCTLTSSRSPIRLDLRELEFLNSSGITMFSRFVIEARERAEVSLQFHASQRVPWQARSLKNLQRLMPALEIQIS